MGKIIEWISGYKTYMVCVAAILTATVAYIDGSLTIIQFIEAIWAAITGITLRLGIAKIGKTNGKTP